MTMFDPLHVLGMRCLVGARTVAPLFPAAPVTEPALAGAFAALPRDQVLKTLAALDEAVWSAELRGERRYQYQIVTGLLPDGSFRRTLLELLLRHPEAIAFHGEQVRIASSYAAAHSTQERPWTNLDLELLAYALLLVNSLLQDAYNDAAPSTDPSRATEYGELRLSANNAIDWVIESARFISFLELVRAQFGRRFDRAFAQVTGHHPHRHLAFALATGRAFLFNRREPFDRGVPMMSPRRDGRPIDSRFERWLRSIAISRTADFGKSGVPLPTATWLTTLRAPLIEQRPGDFFCINRAGVENLTTDGLFFAIADTLEILGAPSEFAFRQFGPFVERRVRAAFHAAFAAPVHVDGDEDVTGANGISDALVFTTDAAYVLEVHVTRTPQVTIATPPEPATIEALFERLAFKKLRQLDASIRRYRAGAYAECPPGYARVQPILVTLRHIPQAGALRRRIDRYVTERGLFDGCPPLLMLAANDVERLPGLVRAGFDFEALLAQKATDPATAAGGWDAFTSAHGGTAADAAVEQYTRAMTASFPPSVRRALRVLTAVPVDDGDG